jgi:hypothetical protein
LSARLADDLLLLDKELSEIDLLISQAKTEAGRHETRREAAAGKLAGMPDHADTRDRLEQSTALIMLTQRAALMQTQVEVLDGKRRAIARYRDAIAEYLLALEGADATATGSGTLTRRWTRPWPGCSWGPRKTCVARSRARCTTGPRRA